MLNGPSYKSAAGLKQEYVRSDQTTPWLPNVCTLMVLAMLHPADDPPLYGFESGNTTGNRRLTRVPEALMAWMVRTQGVHAKRQLFK